MANLLQQIAKAQRTLETPDFMRKSVNNMQPFDKLPQPRQEYIRCEIETILNEKCIKNDNKDRLHILQTVYTDDKIFVSTVIHLRGRKIIGVAKVVVC